jgi:hypothetical protein
MSIVSPKYLIDTNVLIEAWGKYYAFDIVPGFWEWLVQQHHRGNVCSIDKVRGEIKKPARPRVSLHSWSRSLPKTFFKSTRQRDVQREYSQVMAWVGTGGYKPWRIAEFANGADGFLVAFAKAKGMTLVTLESEREPEKVKLPVVCRAFNVEYWNTFRLLRELGATFELK